MTATLTAAILFNDHTDVEAHQGANVRTQAAIIGGNQNAIPNAGQADADLLDPRIERTGGDIDALEQLNFLCPTEHIQRVVLGIQGLEQGTAERLHTTILPGAGN